MGTVRVQLNLLQKTRCDFFFCFACFRCQWDRSFARRPIKNRRFWAKNAPPPGKPVTFYECHPEDHAPAPSVRADLTHMHVRTHTHTTSLMMKQTILSPHMCSVKLMLILTESLAGIACPRNLTIFAHCWWTKKWWSQSKCNNYQNMRQMFGRALKYQLPLLFICVIVLYCFLCLLACLKVYFIVLYVPLNNWISCPHGWLSRPLRLNIFRTYRGICVWIPVPPGWVKCNLSKALEASDK